VSNSQNVIKKRTIPENSDKIGGWQHFTEVAVTTLLGKEFHSLMT